MTSRAAIGALKLKEPTLDAENSSLWRTETSTAAFTAVSDTHQRRHIFTAMSEMHRRTGLETSVLPSITGFKREEK